MLTSIHVTKYTKEKNGIIKLDLSDTGKTLIKNFKDAEYVAEKFIENHHPYEKITPALIYAVSLIDKVFQFLIKSFIDGRDNSFTEDCYLHIKKKTGRE